jgi:hypothetical protein
MSSKNLAAEIFPDIFPPRKIRILGAGRFGRIAAERLKRRFPGSSLRVIDKAVDKVEAIRRELQIYGEVADSLQSIAGSALSEDAWIIPAIPVHVGFEWVLHAMARIGEIRRLPVPEDVASQVPNPVRSPSGALYSGFATFICADNCSEPDEICTHTGKPRLGNLYEVLEKVCVSEFNIAVLRSWQLAPGVGGYPVRRLNDLLEKIHARAGKHLIATSCRCHGVIDALEWRAG